MLDFNTFKKKLGDIALTMTDEEIKRLLKNQDKMAEILFNMWLKKIKRKIKVV